MTNTDPADAARPAPQPARVETMTLEAVMESAVEANGDPDNRVWDFLPDAMAQYARRFGVENDERALRASAEFWRYAAHVAIESDWLIDAFVACTQFAVTSDGRIAFW
jgi:peroxiredoxin